MHLDNLRRIKGTVDMREPQQFKHLKKKMKKTQMMEGKWRYDGSLKAAGPPSGLYYATYIYMRYYISLCANRSGMSSIQILVGFYSRINVLSTWCPDELHFLEPNTNLNLYLYVSFLVERYTEIERENRILLEKMTNILQK